ncbi:MAG: single-stranded DNA-binding protein [Acidimicrobiales bacterium]
MADNTVTIIGNVTRDPELRFTPSGQALATFGMAVNRRWQNRQTQEWEEATSFFDIVCWGTLADNVSDSLGKGARVIVTGRLDQRSWETQEGEKRSKVEVVADEVGPSLRWATAKPEKTERRDAQRGGYAGGSDRPAAGGERGGYSADRPGGAAPAGVPTYSDDEEPF